MESTAQSQTLPLAGGRAIIPAISIIGL